MNALKTIDRNRLAVIGVGLAAVLFLAVNLAVNLSLRSAQVDLTERGLYTLSDGTRKVLTSLTEPITLRLYFTRALGESYPGHQAYANRVRELLERYVNISGGKIRLEVKNPEAFSEVEDEAVTFGLQGLPYDQSGDRGYFGLAGTNSVDGKAVIPYFTTEREPFLEYDLTKLVYSLATLDRPVVGMVARLPVEGGFMMGQRPVPAWAVISQIRELFDVRTMPAEFNAVPPEIGMLMLVHPKNLSDETLYAIDQFVMRGGRVLAFIDPNAETEAPSPQGPPGPSDIDRLLKSWGVTFIKDKVAADLQSARRVNVRHEGQITQVDYVAWNTLDRRNLDTTDAVVADIRDLNVGSAGILEPAEDATTTFRPLVTTSEDSEALDVAKLQGRIDIVALFRDFKASGKKLTMAARVTGPVKSAFPDGPPLIGEGEDAEKARLERAKTHLAESQKPLNAVVVADTDVLHEGLWAEIRNVNGEQLLVPYAGNSDFVINAVENLSGGDVLLGLRSRGDSKRPFLMVEKIQLEAERKFRAEQEKLAKELQETQKRIEGLTNREGANGEAILTAEEKTAIAEFRRKMIDIRHDLRNVQHALRKDIDALDAWLKFLNIAAIPLILGFAALIIAVARRLSRARARPVTE
ncbi:MAG TPA: ABC transporter [Rhodospirillaceae bacterium]|nr:ABC transporter [Magnetovibrio sp.]HCS69000.1 ABC transporter [Rhodospirillaceae bacterium]|tara:strand:+ start:2746 stop:4656 length:1911 start_codon:yes stop_codon:yes gene_type:complete